MSDLGYFHFTVWDEKVCLDCKQTYRDGTWDPEGPRCVCCIVKRWEESKDNNDE